MTSASEFVLKKLHQKPAILFSKTGCPECKKVKAMLNSIRVFTTEIYDVIELEKRGDCSQVQDILWLRTDLHLKTVPLLFINGVYFGGYDRILGLYQEKRLRKEVVSKLDEVKIKAAEIALSKAEEIVVRFQELDLTEVHVEIQELNKQEDLGDGEFNCPSTGWGFDPWAHDEGYDADANVKAAEVQANIKSRLMRLESMELKVLRSNSFRQSTLQFAIPLSQ